MENTKTDVIFKEFWRQNERFADLFNTVVFQAIFSDYRMNLLEVRSSGKYWFNNRDVRIVFDITREAFAGNLDAIRKTYETEILSPELFCVIGKMTGSEEEIIRIAGVTKEEISRAADQE